MWEDFGDYQGIELSDESVTPEKLAGTIEFFGVNLFNPKKASIGSSIGSDTGTIVTGNNVYCLSDYIPVLLNTKYVKLVHCLQLFINHREYCLLVCLRPVVAT